MFFNAVREGDLVMFACDDEQDRMLWVQAIYRATGQSYKPVPPLQNRTTNCRGGLQKPASPISRFWFFFRRFRFVQNGGIILCLCRLPVQHEYRKSRLQSYLLQRLQNKMILATLIRNISE